MHNIDEQKQQLLHGMDQGIAYNAVDSGFTRVCRMADSSVTVASVSVSVQLCDNKWNIVKYETIQVVFCVIGNSSVLTVRV